MFDINMTNVSRTNLLDRSESKSKIKDEANANAFYMAIVTNTNDFYKLGRVQIRIPAIHRIRGFRKNLYIRLSFTLG